MKWIALALLVVFALVWLDPSHVSEREAQATREVAAQARAIEADAAWDRWLTPTLIGCAMALAVAGTAAGVACLLLAPVALHRRVTSWRPDAYGMIPLSDAQRERAAVALVEGHQDVRRIEAGAVAPQLTQVVTGDAELLRAALERPTIQ